MSLQPNMKMSKRVQDYPTGPRGPVNRFSVCRIQGIPLLSGTAEFYDIFIRYIPFLRIVLMDNLSQTY